MIHKFVLFLLLAGCGAEKSKDDAVAPAADPIEEPNQATPTNPPDAPLSTATPTSLAINTTADIPVCVSANDRQLIYVLETKSFQVCGNGAWSVIEVIQPAAQQVSNEWINPVDGRRWYMGDIQSDAVPPHCGPGWSVPKVSELGLALWAGMYARFLPLIALDVRYKCAGATDGRMFMDEFVSCGGQSYGVYCRKD